MLTRESPCSLSLVSLAWYVRISYIGDQASKLLFPQPYLQIACTQRRFNRCRTEYSFSNACLMARGWQMKVNASSSTGIISLLDHYCSVFHVFQPLFASDDITPNRNEFISLLSLCFLSTPGPESVADPCITSNHCKLLENCERQTCK